MAVPQFKICLDFDGVIFKNPHAMKIVSNRSAQFVSKKLKVSYANAKLINSTQYKVHGHTVNYLIHTGVDTSLNEYNEFVFNHIDWDNVEMNLTNEDYEPIIDIHLLNKIQKQKSVIFSNAPRVWVDKALEKLGTHHNVLFDQVFTCETLNQLKPNNKPYEEIEEYYPNTDLLFIDDGILNLHNLGDRWKPHWFKPTDNIFQCGKKMINDGAYLNTIETLDSILYPDLHLYFS
jgi:FMN phosphatase YigB (HAD superfamily)